MSDTSDPKPVYGVHSEVGTLRKVMVCAPGLAHTRLTPTNNDDLLFDDLLWVTAAKRDHYDFMLKTRERGVEVVEMHELLAEYGAEVDFNIDVNERLGAFLFGFWEHNGYHDDVADGDELDRTLRPELDIYELGGGLT